MLNETGQAVLSFAEAPTGRAEEGDFKMSIGSNVHASDIILIFPLDRVKWQWL